MADIGVRAILPTVLVFGLAACRDATSPPAGPPARIVVTSGATFTGPAGTLLQTPLTVRVTDDQDRAVGGAVVRFSFAQGAGTLSPQSVATDRAGLAATRLTFGLAAGSYQVLATVTGIQVAARFNGVASAGTAARVVVTPGQARLAAVGDSMRLRAAVYDAHGNPISTAGIVWSAADPDVFSIDPTGLVTGTKELGVGRAIASAAGRADTAFVVVANPNASPCLGYAPAVTLAVGQSTTVSMTDGACIAAAGVEDEYVIIPWHGSRAASSRVTIQVRGDGLTPVTATQSLAPPADAGLRAAAATAADPERAFQLEQRIRDMGRREVMPLARRARGPSAAASFTASRAAAIPAGLALGAHVELNANPNTACSSPSMRTGRVAAVGSRAIVVHDTANPAGGFADADYQRFAAAFDTLVAPVAEAAFGAPTDVDGNGKVVIFFTRAVNELTPPGVAFYYGGFFHPRDLMPRSQNGAPFCAASNEGEMFYMLVPDVDGVVNGNRRRVGFVDSVTIGTLAHEYQHLINAGRRAYVNRAVTDEEVWLNEGLSHIAEELVFHHTTRTGPRQNIGGDRFGTPGYDGLFVQYMAPNFGRLRVHLQSPASSSPYGGAEDLAVRGAAWAFLRYAADRRAGGEGDVWMRLVNSTSAGLTNLEQVFGPGVLTMVRDWAIAAYTDDYVPEAAAVFTQPSWNFRTAYPAVPGSPRAYPLLDAMRALTNGVSRTTELRGGGAAYYRFSIAPGGEAAIRVTSAGTVPAATVQATIVRRR